MSKLKTISLTIIALFAVFSGSVAVAAVFYGQWYYVIMNAGLAAFDVMMFLFIREALTVIQEMKSSDQA